ncbi:hypothetical protein RZS08_50955, partial [Arthrospira platensis SPKY1]|nr:hypothetical protein [Arthrospira platensis SPKY1]
ALIRHRDELLLVTDRLGMQPIYIWENAPYFACSTELKTFLELPGFSPEMDTESLHCFLETGQLLGEKTWFRHVRLLPAATIARYAGSPLKKKQEYRYWSWSAIQPVSANR